MVLFKPLYYLAKLNTNIMVEHQAINLKVMGAILGQLYCSVTPALLHSKELVSTSNDTLEHSYDNWLLLYNQHTIAMSYNQAQAMLPLSRSGCYQITFAVRGLVSQLNTTLFSAVTHPVKI